MNKQQFKELPDEEKMKMIYDLLRMVNDYIVKCFGYWGWMPSRITLGDRNICEQILKDCNWDNEILRDAFIEGKAQGKETLAYVRTVAKNIYEKKAVKKNREEHEELKNEEKQAPYNFANDEDWQKLKNKMSIK